MIEKTYSEFNIAFGGEDNELDDHKTSNKRARRDEKWGNDIEFLFSCISLSVGLGNVWRFPFIAFQNGGGAFLIPYLLVLLIVGRPVYYLEIIIGQFSGRGCIKAFGMAPILKGVAAGQVLTTGASITYYSCIMALTLRYLIASFSYVLPWSYCRSEWELKCLNGSESFANDNQTVLSAAELYFQNEVLHEKNSIDDGIGYPNMNLVTCLAIAWVTIGAVLIKGIKSSGKASYFLGIFPYIVLLILLGRAVTLPGANNGIIYFFKPQWQELLNPLVWFAAVTQVFFSLAICFGTLITYASYNKFSRNVYNDIVIITVMDLCSSIISGCITFGILGNFAFQKNSTDIASVVKGGAGLAFISYPDAIAKFEFLPQVIDIEANHYVEHIHRGVTSDRKVFSVLFFSMLFVLGVGSTVGMGSCIIRVIRDRFARLPHWPLALSLSLIGFGVSIIYMTPGGQFILNLIDFHGVSFPALVLAIGELLTVSWAYGIKQFCDDIFFMTGKKTGRYWRFCWRIVTPGLMISVLVYNLILFEPITYKNTNYPQIMHVLAWTITAACVCQIPCWAFYSIFMQPANGFIEVVFYVQRFCSQEKLYYRKLKVHLSHINLGDQLTKTLEKNT